MCVQVGKLIAKGGDDEPEDVLGALHQVASMAWAGNARFCLLITDAPPHGRGFHSDRASVVDAYPGGVPGLTTTSVMEELVRADVELLFCHVNKPATEQAERVLAETYNAVQAASASSRPDRRMLQGIDLRPPPPGPAGPAGAGGPAAPAVAVPAAPVPAAMPPAPHGELGTHFVFVVDESGSMLGPKWAAVIAALNSFKQTRLAAGGSGQGVLPTQDIVSVVRFATTSTIPIK
jgi:hypothetical protein